MLKSLELENFKAFGERVKIPFAPITLIFGENSSGKSSILQSLNLLKQTRESREAGALLLPRTEQGISDLGSFQDLLFDHDLSRTLSIKIVAELEQSKFGDINTDTISLEFNFNRPSLEKDIFLNEIKVFINDSNKCLAKFKTITNIFEAPEEVYDEFPHLYDDYQEDSNNQDCQLPVVRCTYITTDPKIWESRFIFCKENKKQILEFLENLLLTQQEYIKSKDKSNAQKLDEIFSSETRKTPNRETKKYFETRKNVFAGVAEELSFNKAKILAVLQNAINFYSSDFEIEKFISRMESEYINKCIEIKGFLPAIVFEHNSEDFIEERYIKFLNSNEKKVFTLDFRQLTILAGKVVAEVLEDLFPLGPLRKSPERWYIFTGTSPKDVGYKGELLPDLLFRSPQLVEEANSWLDRLDIGYHLKIMSLGERTKDLFEVQLIDTRRTPNIEVGLPDVGFGISQILPFIVQSLVSEGKIISIEQPEVHIHPRLQADLGDLLAETIKSPRNNQFIIETHSEHLVLRLQKLVSEKNLSPNDVSIIYVSRGANGSKVQQLQLDEEGDFVDDWPGGFFPERLRELR